MTETEKAQFVSDVLSDWHYDPAGLAPDSEHCPHGSFTDSYALTHCICWAAAYRVLTALDARGARARAGT